MATTVWKLHHSTSFFVIEAAPLHLFLVIACFSMGWEDLTSESALFGFDSEHQMLCDAACLHMGEVLPGSCLCAAVHDDNLGNNLPASS